MSDRQSAKAVVLDYFSAIDKAAGSDVGAAIAGHASADYRFRGVHPFNEIEGTEETAKIVWQPLRASFAAWQRRQDIFMAGPNLVDGSMWVTSMGTFLGLFDKDWLGIPSTGKIALLPYCEFHRIADGKIAESALWIDIIAVMKQAGVEPLPSQTGADIINPGPANSDGVLLDAQDETESKQTLDLIMRMCHDLINDRMESPADSLRKTWHEDMNWFGPAGIGATRTIDRYLQQHQGPFRSGLRDINFKGHVLEHADGHYGAWFGWPNLHMKQGDGFLGLTASDRQTEMRVVDVYRRDGDKLAENWIFIDFLHYLKLLGVDVLERCRSMVN